MPVVLIGVTIGYFIPLFLFMAFFLERNVHRYIQNKKEAEKELAKKNIYLIETRRPQKKIPTYLWVFSKMTTEQTYDLCGWMGVLTTQLNIPDNQTYTKYFDINKKKISVKLPSCPFSMKWEKIEWHLIPQGEDGFILEGDVSWINSKVLALLPKAI